MKILINVPASVGRNHSTRGLQSTIEYHRPVLRENPGKPELTLMPQWVSVEERGSGAYRVVIQVPGYAETKARTVLESLGSEGVAIEGVPGSVITPFKTEWISVED